MNALERSKAKKMDLHAFTELGVRAGFVLVPAVPEPSLDLPHLPVQLLGEAVQMAGVWALWVGNDTTQLRLHIRTNQHLTSSFNLNDAKMEGGTL